MKDVKVLGPGCARCQATADMVRDQAVNSASTLRSRR